MSGTCELELADGVQVIRHGGSLPLLRLALQRL